MTGMSLYDRVGRARRRRGRVLALVVVLLVGGGVGAWWLLRPVPEDPRVAAAALAAAWSDGEVGQAPFTAAPRVDVADRYATIVDGLDADPPTVEVGVVAAPAPDAPLATTAELTVTWTLGGDRRWSYETQADVVRAEDELTWSVVWEPALVHPRLVDGLVLRARRTTPARGDVVDADGSAIVTGREVVDVGIEPARLEDLEQLIADLSATLADVLEVDLDRPALVDRVQGADEHAFVEVLTLREDDYLQVRDAIQPLPGTVFRRRRTPLPPTRGFARFTLGSVGPVTAEMLEEQPNRHVAGDVAGRSGLQAAYDQRLFGTPGIEVVLSGDDPPDEPVLFADEAVPGDPVTVALDVRVQRAADAAVEGTGFPTGLAVVRPSDGHVLALANSSEARFDVARSGRVPPGSTFKVVTTQALLDDTDLAPSTPVDCPAEVTVGGRTISNAESQRLGTVPFRTAFVNSCNTAFVQLSQDLSDTSLQRAAARFGIGGQWDLGLDAFAGQVPVTGDAVDLAATAIGQGRTLVSPLAMAGVAATVAHGGFPGLSLVLEPAPDGGADLPEPLPGSRATLLQELTRGVVTAGTGTALADAPGGPVHGKTGTAEFSADGELRTHAWFVGFQGDMAFAVVVTDTPGAYGGDAAAPVVARLLDALASDAP